MKPEQYAWNDHERNLYIDNKLQIPSPYKIKIIDEAEERLQLELVLNTMTQKDLAIWARKNAERFLGYINIGDEQLQADIISSTSLALEKRIGNELTAYELRKAGFLANSLASKSTNEVSKFASRVFAQAIATGHMRGHAIVSADYAIRVINLLTNDSKDEAVKERKRQIELAKSVVSK